MTENTPHNVGEQGGPARPSEAYQQAIESPVYALSELMFGSLLASYVLGFIGLLAIQSSTSSWAGFWGIALPVIQYTSISITFAYLTAGLYVTYHAGILTMYHMPLERLGFDFLLALTTAVSFGFALLFPRAFPILVGFILLSAAVRQRMEHLRLVKKLYSDTKGVPYERDRDVPRAFKEKFSSLIQEDRFSELSTWSKARPRLVGFAIALMVIGIIVAKKSSIHWLSSKLGWDPTASLLPQAIVAGESFVVLLFVFFAGHTVLHERATFLSDRKKKTTDMDDQFEVLLQELK